MPTDPETPRAPVPDHELVRPRWALNYGIAANGAVIVDRDRDGRIVDEHGRPLEAEWPEDEPRPGERCGLCGRLTPLAPGRSICPDCAFFPLD